VELTVRDILKDWNQIHFCWHWHIVLVAFSALMLLAGRQEGHPACKKICGGWWRWALGSLDGVAPSRMVGVSASVNLPLHHKVQKFSSGTGSPGWSRKKGRKMVVVVVLAHSVGCHLNSKVWNSFLSPLGPILFVNRCVLWKFYWKVLIFRGSPRSVNIGTVKAHINYYQTWVPWYCVS